VTNLDFWDNFGIGFIKGHAVSLATLAVVGPVWAFLRFGWWLGLLALMVGFAALMASRWLWRFARRWGERGSQE
jgi:uncharacterized membrane protein YccF (DUF307 family)